MNAEYRGGIFGNGIYVVARVRFVGRPDFDEFSAAESHHIRQAE